MSLGEALGGAFQGLGRGLVQHGENLRQEAREKRDAERRQSERAENRQWSQQDRAEDRAYREEWRNEDRAYDASRREATASADANVYASLFGTESGGRFDIKNSEGYTGRSQFGDERLTDFSRAMGIGPINKDEFQKNPKLQKDVEKWHFEDINGFIDKNGLDRFEGETIGGVKITRSGIIAMAHLGGANGAKKFLESGGKYNPADSNGTSLSGYARTHGGKSTSMDGVWDAIADPDVSPAVRKDAIARATAGNNPKLSSEEWVLRDGKEVLMGRDGNTMRPYKDENGDEITRKPTKSDRRSISSSVSKQIDEWADTEGVEASVKRKFKLEVERLVNTGKTETEAWDEALATANRTQDVTTESDGFLGLGKRSSVVSGTYDGTFGDKPAGDTRTAQATPAMPSEPSALGASKSDAIREAKAAIARGADPAQVRARLVEMGFDPEDI